MVSRFLIDNLRLFTQEKQPCNESQTALLRTQRAGQTHCCMENLGRTESPQLFVSECTLVDKSRINSDGESLSFSICFYLSSTIRDENDRGVSLWRKHRSAFSWGSCLKRKNFAVHVVKELLVHSVRSLFHCCPLDGLLAQQTLLSSLGLGRSSTWGKSLHITGKTMLEQYVTFERSERGLPTLWLELSDIPQITLQTHTHTHTHS